MIELLTVIGISVFGVWSLWVGYVAVMHLRNVRNKWGLTKTQKIFGYPALVLFYILDVVLRLTVFSVLFLRFPKLETVSKMLEDEMDGTGWRKSFAHYIRETALADFDNTGSHGKPGR